MCTFSFSRLADNSRIITMNRDEARERHEGDFHDQTHGQKQLLYPRDERSGGTWFGCNHHGLSIALLNRYQCDNPKAYLSRGLLIPQFLATWSNAAQIQRLSLEDLIPYPPFDMISCDSQQCLQLTWDGVSVVVVEHSQGDFSFSSSGLNTEYVLAQRQHRYKQLLKSNVLNPSNTQTRASQLLSLYHLEQDPLNPYESVFMDRPEAHTKSICQLLINQTSLSFKYLDEQILKQVRNQTLLKENLKHHGHIIELFTQTQAVAP